MKGVQQIEDVRVGMSAFVGNIPAQDLHAVNQEQGGLVLDLRIPQDLERIGKAGQTVVGDLSVQFENGGLELPQRVACPAGLASAV